MPWKEQTVMSLNTLRHQGLVICKINFSLEPVNKNEQK